MSETVIAHERQVLGSMLVSAAAIDDAAEILEAADFLTAPHEDIYAAILGLVAEGKPVDPLSVADWSGGDVTYPHELVAGVVTAASAAWHAEKVRDAAMVRKVRATGANLMGMSEMDADALDLVNDARAALDALISDRGAETTTTDDVAAAIESLERPLGIKPAWQSLADGISGWAPGMLYIGGARPGVGKTVLGIGALLGVAQTSTRAVMFSLEMPKTELYLRMLANIGTVDNGRIMHRVLTQRDHERISDAVGKISALPLTVDDRSAVSLAQMRAKIRTVQRKEHVGLVVVDYLGLVKPPPDAGRSDRRVQVDAIAQGLKNLAKDLEVPILALAQLNRGIEGRSDKMPTMADLRESGGIEAAADVVILMHRDTTLNPNSLDVVIAKNRHGPQTRFQLNFEGAYSRVSENWNSTTALGA